MRTDDVSELLFTNRVVGQVPNQVRQKVGIREGQIIAVLVEKHPKRNESGSLVSLFEGMVLANAAEQRRGQGHHVNFPSVVI